MEVKEYLGYVIAIISLSLNLINNTRKNAGVLAVMQNDIKAIKDSVNVLLGTKDDVIKLRQQVDDHDRRLYGIVCYIKTMPK